MKTFTYSEARQQLASVLELAKREGEILIRRKDGQLFILRPATTSRSPLDVSGIDIGITSDEIISMQREIRERDKQ